MQALLERIVAGVLPPRDRSAQPRILHDRGCRAEFAVDLVEFVQHAPRRGVVADVDGEAEPRPGVVQQIGRAAKCFQSGEGNRAAVLANQGQNPRDERGGGALRHQHLQLDKAGLSERIEIAFLADRRVEDRIERHAPWTALSRAQGPIDLIDRRQGEIAEQARQARAAGDQFAGGDRGGRRSRVRVCGGRDDIAATGPAAVGEIEPSVHHVVARFELREPREGLGEVADGNMAHQHGGGRQRRKRKPRRHDDAGQAEAADRQFEQLGILLGRKVEQARERMEQPDAADMIAEQPFAELVFAVNVAGDAAADRDVRMAGLNRQAKAARGEKFVQPPERDAGFDLDPALGLVEGEDAVEPPHSDAGGARAEARRHIGNPGAPADQRLGRP